MVTGTSPWVRELALAQLLAREAARIALARPVWERKLKVKPEDGTFVTQEDLDVARFMRVAIGANFTGDIVLTEEDAPGARTPSAGDRHWNIDPIDGTGSHLFDLALFCSSVAFVFRGVTVAAATCNLSTGEVVWAVEGGGAFVEGGPFDDERRQIHVASPRRPLYVAGAGRFEPDGTIDDTIVEIDPHDGCMTTVETLQGIPSVTAGRGVGKGVFDAFVYPGKGAHDLAAVDLIVREAGGVSTDLFGQPLRFDRREIPGGILAAPHAHALVLDIWRRTQAKRGAD